MISLTASPRSKTFKAGMDVMPYLAASSGFSSVLSLTMSSLSWLLAISSSTGAIIRQGVHHSAQKSTSTGLSLFRTFSSKSASVTCWMFPIFTPCMWLEVSRDDEFGLDVLRDLDVGEVPLGIECRLATGARSGDRLPVGVVDEISCREDPGEIGSRGRCVDEHVP